MTRKLFIAIIIFFLTLTGKLIIDLALWFDGGTNNHLLGPIIVFVLLGFCSWLAKWWSIPMWFFMFWALMDSFWGLFSGNGFFYIGDTAKLDILQRNYQWVQVLKYTLAVGATVFFIVKQKKK